jgi:hypothetical protein
MHATAVALGTRYNVIRAIEAGFEDKNANSNTYYIDWLSDNKREGALLRRYHEVGRNIARQAGLDFYTD